MASLPADVVLPDPEGPPSPQAPGCAPAQGQLGSFAAEQVDEFVVHGLDELLRGGQALFDFLPEHALAHAFHEFLDDLEVDVGFQQGKTHLAQAIADVFLGELRPTAQRDGNALDNLSDKLSDMNFSEPSNQAPDTHLYPKSQAP